MQTRLAPQIRRFPKRCFRTGSAPDQTGKFQLRYSSTDWETSFRTPATETVALLELQGLLSDAQIDIIALAATVVIFAAYFLLRQGSRPAAPRTRQVHRLLAFRPLTVPVCLPPQTTRPLTRQPEQPD